MSLITASQRRSRGGRSSHTSALPGRFEALDSWRGICALLVATFHLHVTWHGFETILVRRSWMFVDFFFVLSGFVIMSAYGGGRLSSAADARRFLLRRLGRVWPLHLAMLGVLLAFEVLKLVLASGLGIQFLRPAFDQHTSLASLGPNILLVHALGLFQQAAWNTPSWTISAEFYTYVLFAIVAVAVGRRVLLAAAALLAALCALLLLMVSDRYLAAALDFGIFRCGYGFMLGCLAFRLAHRLAGWPGFGLCSELLAIAAVALVPYTGFTVWNMCAPVVFALAIVVFAQERGQVSRLLRTRPLLSLGRISYSIYMVHLPILLIGFERFQRFVFARIGGHAAAVLPYTDLEGDTFPVLEGPPLLGDAMVLVYLALVIAIAQLSFRYIEDPWRKRFRTWTSPALRSPYPIATAASR